MKKAVIRHKLITDRKNFSNVYVQNASEKVIARLARSIDWSSIGTIHTYLPKKQSNEISTISFLEFLRREYPEIKTYSPFWDGESVKTVHFDPSSSLSDVKNGILQPDVVINGVIPLLFDLVVVPVVGFDEKCNRIGYGSGYYDRFLGLRENQITIGLAYERSKVAGLIPVDEHDVRLDRVITEKDIYHNS